MPSNSIAIPAGLTRYLQSLARIIFGFLVLRHGMEQAFAFPEASAAARMSFEGVIELIALPAGVLIMLGLFTRQTALLLAIGYIILFFVGPLTRGPFPHRNGGDPILLNGFFFLYLAAAGVGAWGVDSPAARSVERLRGRDSYDEKGAPIALGVLRIAAGCLFIMHGLEKFFAVGGGRIDRDTMNMCGPAGWLESFLGPLY